MLLGLEEVGIVLKVDDTGVIDAERCRVGARLRVCCSLVDLEHVF